jgi:isochorismate hydrolase
MTKSWETTYADFRNEVLVTLVSDACTTSSAERHNQSLLGIRGYCRQCATESVIAEIEAARAQT